MAELAERRDAEERGTLDVRTRAIERLAERAVLETPGTVAHRGSLGGLIGGSAPSAHVSTSGPGVRVVLDVAATYPADIGRIAAEVRDHVLRRAADLSGVGVTTVDVTVHLVSPDEVATPRRVQ